MTEVKRRAQRHTDRAGDPLDGLVNMFDLGIVLAVGFLIAALQSANLTQVLTHRTSIGGHGQTLVIKKDQELVPLKAGAKRIAIKGAGPIGMVYELPSGQLAYVRKK
jgi:hypothetical protein